MARLPKSPNEITEHPVTCCSRQASLGKNEMVTMLDLDPVLTVFPLLVIFFHLITFFYFYF
jgi:hypothetical protein